MSARVEQVLRELADDETRHAELAWRTLAWICERDPSIVPMLRALASRLHARERETAKQSIVSGPSHEGRLSTAEAAAVARDAWREVILPSFEIVVARAERHDRFWVD